MITQVQREGKLVADDGRFDPHRSGRVADPEESRKTPTFGLVGVDGESPMAATARMHRMILKTTF